MSTLFSFECSKFECSRRGALHGDHLRHRRGWFATIARLRSNRSGAGTAAHRSTHHAQNRAPDHSPASAWLLPAAKPRRWAKGQGAGNGYASLPAVQTPHKPHEGLSRPGESSFTQRIQVCNLRLLHNEEDIGGGGAQRGSCRLLCASIGRFARDSSFQRSETCICRVGGHLLHLEAWTKKQTADGNNPFFAVVERCGGVELERIEDLQSNKNKQNRDQALAIVKIFEQDRVEQ